MDDEEAFGRGFSVVQQTFGIEVDFAGQSLTGWTELTVAPNDPLLRKVKLNCRQCQIKNVTVNKREALYEYNDVYRTRLHEGSTVYQHHQLRKRLREITKLDWGELAIIIPKQVKIEAQEYTGILTQPVIQSSYIAGTPVSAYPNTITPGMFKQMVVRIEYNINHPTAGVHFVGCEPGDNRYPHLYTTNDTLPGSASSWLPCIDELRERCPWQMDITVPKRIRDIFPPRPAGRIRSPHRTRSSMALHNGETLLHEPEKKVPTSDFSQEELDLEMVVVCAGEFVKETSTKTSPNKTVTFIVPQLVASHQIAFAVGPFSKMNLSDLREYEEDDLNNIHAAVDIFGYCLPGRDPELRNSSLFMSKAMDHFVREHGSFPYSTFKLCFVDDAPQQVQASASITICSNNILYPPEIIDFIYPTTKLLTVALTSQWIGVNIVPKKWSDIWLTIGLSHYMADIFLKKLMGNNEYRFRMRKAIGRICMEDIGQQPLADQKMDAPLPSSTIDFIALKAPVVLFILNQRLTKPANSMGLQKVITKILLDGMSGDLVSLSTATFLKKCEKHGHMRLDTFANQYIFGTGVPRFQVTQRFNRKKMVIEVILKQLPMNQRSPRKLQSDTFIDDGLKHLDKETPAPIQHLFTGPMTLRVYDDEGTPYEQTIDIRETVHRAEIHYNNTRRAKRKRKDTSALTNGDLPVVGEDVVISLGDVLTSASDMQDWKLVDWSADDEDRMASDAFEWIRIDADLEWICDISLGMPEWMYAAQLRQDRDVIAQYESIKFFAEIKESAVISTIMVRTLMDERYYYGIRQEAAYVLSKCATQSLGWLGETHLRYAFQKLFCFPNSATPMGNDFSDFRQYFIKCTIPLALAQIKDGSGDTKNTIKMFLIKLLKFNDNSNNDYSDCYYLASLMKAVTTALIPSGEGFHFGFGPEDEGIKDSVFSELERLLRMDRWAPSFQYTVSQAALAAKEQLSLKGMGTLTFSELLLYTREGVFDVLRAQAFDILLNLGAPRHPPLVKFIFFTLRNDPSLFIRHRLVRSIGTGFGSMALTGNVQARNQTAGDEMVIEEDAAQSVAVRKDLLERASISGAIQALRKELSADDTLKEEMWNCANSSQLDLSIRQRVLDLCRILYDEKTSYIVVLQLPKKRKRFVCHHLGKGKIIMRWEYPGEVPPKWKPVSPPVHAPMAPPPFKLKIKLTGLTGSS